MKTMTALIFDNYETLDLFGPVEMFGRLHEQYRIRFASLQGGLITNAHGVSLATASLEDLAYSTDILLVVGGQGTRQLVSDETFLTVLKRCAMNAKWVLSVCTGSALLAQTGLLDGRQATSNKRAWDWVVSQSDKVDWVHKARWVVDGKYYTSSGISAGMDMALGFIADRHGLNVAKTIAFETEYRWQNDKDMDAFGKQLDDSNI